MRKVWTVTEEETMRARYPDTLTSELAPLFRATVDQIHAKASRMGLRKSAVFMATNERVQLRPGTLIGMKGRFRKGNIPPNKGVRSPGYAPGRMAETQFKPGRRDRIPVGGHRVDRAGFLYRRTSDTGYGGTDWKFEHRLLWEEANGPIPAGHKLAFKDGDRKHVSLDNLELVTNAEMMRRKSFRNNYPPEIVEVIKLSGLLTRTIRRRERGKKQNVGPEGPPVRDAGSVEGRGEAHGA